MKNHSNPVRNTSVRGETCSYESALLAVNQSCQLLTLKLDYFLTSGQRENEASVVWWNDSSASVNKTDETLIVCQSLIEYSTWAWVKLILKLFYMLSNAPSAQRFSSFFFFLQYFSGSTPCCICGHTALLIGFPEDTLFFILQQKSL